MQYGRKYLIRYLPTQRGFIEVFDLDEEHVGTAYDPDSIPKHRRDEFMAVRARQERDAQAIEYGVRAHRRHLAAVDNAGVGYEDAAANQRLTTDDAGDSPSASAPRASEHDGSAVERLDRAHGENAAERPTPSRRRQPRVPASTPPPEDTATPSALSRLAAVHGDGHKVTVIKKDRKPRNTSATSPRPTEETP